MIWSSIIISMKIQKLRNSRVSMWVLFKNIQKYLPIYYKINKKYFEINLYYDIILRMFNTKFIIVGGVQYGRYQNYFWI